MNKSHLDRDAYKFLQPPTSNDRVNGVGGEVPVLGMFECTIRIGTLSMPVKVTVVDTTESIPILVGQSLLRCKEMKSYKVDLEKKVIRFFTHKGSYEAKFRDHVIAETTTHIHHVALATNTTPHTFNRDTMAKNLKLLKSKFGIKLEHDDEKQLAAFASMLTERTAAFGSDDEFGLLKGAEATLPTSGEPINIPPRRIPVKKEQAVKKQLELMLERGIIEKTEDNGGWNSPIQPVMKKNGDVRITVDFKRSLNRRLVKLDPYPLPSVDSLFDRMRPGLKYFSAVDLAQG